jgi:hypothetical protein
VIVPFVDLGGIDDHCCLDVIVRSVGLEGIQIEQSPLNSNGDQFHQDQPKEQSPLNRMVMNFTG